MTSENDCAANSFDRSVAILRDLLAPVGGKRRSIYCILRHRSASGMSRRISFLVIEEGGRAEQPYLRDITWHVGNVTGYRERANTQGLHVGGCGMDMGFHVVSGLGRKLWPEGTPEPHSTRNGEPDRDGDYAIRHEWV